MLGKIFFLLTVLLVRITGYFSIFPAILEDYRNFCWKLLTEYLAENISTKNKIYIYELLNAKIK